MICGPMSSYTGPSTLLPVSLYSILLLWSLCLLLRQQRQATVRRASPSNRPTVKEERESTTFSQMLGRGAGEDWPSSTPAQNNTK